MINVYCDILSCPCLLINELYRTGQIYKTLNLLIYFHITSYKGLFIQCLILVLNINFLHQSKEFEFVFKFMKITKSIYYS